MHTLALLVLSTDEDEGEVPSYIFGMSSSPAVGMLATVCSDGMLRLWEVGRQHLEEVAVVEVRGTVGS